MNIVTELVQGSPAWHAHRAAHLNASDIPVVMGLSSYKKRDELLRERKTGVVPEVDAATQLLFDDGHRTEALARKIIEREQGECLCPVTATMEIDGLPLSASFDGINMAETFCFEHKRINVKLAALTSVDDLDKQYKTQMTQQMMISGCRKCLFVASDGTKENRIKFWYEYDEALANEVISHWHQFQIDLAEYTMPEVEAEPTANTVDSLPALNVQIQGGVTASNLAEYESSALAFIQAINTDLKTDQDFADADNIVKFCGKTEKELDAVKQAALSQTADIAGLFKTIDTLKAEMRAKRLSLDKLVKAKKQALREEIVIDARKAYLGHTEKLKTRVPEVNPGFPLHDFAGVIKNKRTIASIQDAVNTELARLKIESNEVVDQIESNIKALKEVAGEYGFLFSDLQHIVTKPKEDLINLANARIADHKQAEEAKLEKERERIREEEKERLAAEQKRKDDEAEQEQQKTEPEQVKRPDSNVSSMPSKPAPAKAPPKTLIEEVVACCDSWRVPADATAEICEIIEEHLPESAQHQA